MNKKTKALTAEQYKEIIQTVKEGFCGCRPNERIAQRWSWRGTWGCGSATSSNCDPATSCGMEIATAWRSWSRKQANAGFSQSRS